MRSHLWRNWRNAPRGDFESMCSICGVACARSRLRKKADGMFYCPACQPGRDAVTLSRLNAQAVIRRQRPPIDGGGLDTRGGYTPDERVFSEEFSEVFS